MKKLVSILLSFCLCLSMTAAFAEGEWICESCGATNTQNFCVECGSKPAWECVGCGQSNTTRFCGNCGTSEDASRAAIAYDPLEAFTVEPYWCVYDADGERIAEIPEDTIFLSDLGENDKACVGIRLYNTTDEAKMVKLGVTVNGESFAWGYTEIQADSAWIPDITLVEIQPGDQTVEWRVNGKTVYSGIYVASDEDPVLSYISATPQFAVYNAEDKLLGRFAADAAYAGDYAEGDTIMASLHVTNISDEVQKINTRIVINGSEYTWNETELEPGKAWNQRLISGPMTVGEYVSEWYVNDELVASKTYVVKEGESPMKQALNNGLTVSMALCLWNVAEQSVVENHIVMGDINSQNPDQVYGPRLEVVNNTDETVTVYVSLRSNNDKRSSWLPETLEPGESFGFVSTGVELEKGANSCTWYINGIEVVEEVFFMGDMHVPGVK